MLLVCSVLGCQPQAMESANSTSTPTSLTKPSEKASSKSALPKIDESIDIEGLLEARLPKEDLDLGWIRLFDGQSLMGWRSTSKANWSVKEEAIMVSSGEPGFLHTTSRFGDFELRLDYLASSTTNSGVFLRSMVDPKDVEKDCFELNIAPTDNPFPTGSLVKRQLVEPQRIGLLEESEWHSLHALCDGNHIQTWVDGKIACDYHDTSDCKAGLIGLQFREGAVQFRDIRVRPIAYAVLPAKSLDGWQVGSGDKLTATVTEAGGVTIRGGVGDLELLQNLGDFALQATVLTETKEINSGIFVRCIPGETMNGYECQIQHSFLEDRRLPKDSGTGAIFRRQGARAVLSDEGVSAHITLVADGPHFATWVEGVQVVDWTDTRKPMENPREGLRLEPGTIQIQGHDPTTAITIQSLGISPLP